MILPPERDARHKERVSTRLRVLYGGAATDRVGYAENISVGGLYINTNEVLKAGERLNLCIEFPRRAVLKRGEVMWSITVPQHLRSEMVCGMGISFVDADPDWPEFFRSWKESLRIEA
jgi:Tfp pilus assembly protein PilZ